MLENIITLKAGEIFEVAQGIEAIKQAIQRAYSVQVYDLPPSLLNELAPVLVRREATIYLPPRVKVENQLRPQVVPIKNRVKATCHGQTMFMGHIKLARIMFDIVWQADKIYDISAVTSSKCLRCSHRLNLRTSAEHNGLMFGSILPVSQTITEIEQHLRQADWVLFSNIPPQVVSQLMSALHNKEVKLILPYGVQLPHQLRPIKQTRTFPRLVMSSSRVYGRRVHCGGICLPHIHFGISWEGDKIISVRSFEWLKCVQCMYDTHRLGWHFCKRIW